ncbi:MAG TPA: DMT family transporter [Actinopolymorphaceae bacterium]
MSLSRSYRLGAFNQVYPIARGMSPWVVAVVASVFLSEPLGPVQIVGVLVVSLGLGSLILAKGRPHVDELPAVAAAATTGLLIAGYTVIDGVGVRVSGTALGYAAWLFFLHGLTLLAYAWMRRGRSLVKSARSHWRLGVAAGGSAVAAYGLVLWAQSVGSLATVAALRETSVIVGAIIGAVVFKEPFGRWRTVSTVIVAIGIALLDLG